MNQTRIKPPCFKCKDRTVGCHSSCEKYASFKEELDEIRGCATSENEKKRMLDDYVVNMKIKYKADHPIHRIGKYKGGDKK